MTDTSNGRTPVHLWIVGILALLWNAAGAYAYLATQLENEAYMGSMTEQQAAYFQGLPAWVDSIWAIAVWGAVAASVGLLLRKRWAVWVFGVALAALVVNTLYSFLLAGAAEIMGTGNVIFSVIILVIAIALFIYARTQAQAGVLR